MSARIEYRKTNPGAVEALLGLNRYSDACRIEPRFRRLVEVLVSEINGCSYCISVHTRQAIDLGETSARVEAVATWRDSNLFTKKERTVFLWAERVTMIAAQGVSPDHLTALSGYYTDSEIVDLTFIILAMNAWNRLAIAFERHHDG